VAETLDQAAFGDQIRLHGKLFFRVAFQVLRNSALAEEACQQAICRAWERRHSLSKPSALRAWLASSIVHESLTMLRRVKIEKKALARRTAQDASDPREDRQIHQLPEQLEQQRDVLAAVGGLPELVKEVVVLRMLQGMTGREVAEVLDLSAADVSRKLHSGMELLRRELAGWEPSETRP
jgi:RNA polymerase sigma-70 factor (ECF subfamily)